MANEIIEAEYREVDTGGGCELNRITTEIRCITEQLNRTLLAGIIEIGKRFDRIKAIVPHGKWGEYVEEATKYSQSMAENYIKIYKEYGSEQQSLFGDLSNSKSLGNLGVTKLLELTALPADEREKFVEEHNVTGDTTVKELQELIKKQTAAAEDAEMQFRIKEQELNTAIRRNNDIITEKQAEIDRLTEELTKKETVSDVAPADEMEKMIRDAEEKAAKKAKSAVSKLEKEKESLAAEQDKLKKRLEKLKREITEKDNAVAAAQKAAEEKEAEKAELEKTIAKLQKESLLGSNENLVRLNMVFETAQADINSLKSALKKLEGTDEYEKLKTVIGKTLENAVKEI